jgi:hypothetical protein
MSWRMRGRRVTIPLPRGRKSLLTMFSRTDDFPEDCEPTTTWISLVRSHSGQQIETYYLGEVEGVVPDGVEDEILQLVDNVEQVFAQGRHDEGPTGCCTLYAMGRTDGATGSSL